MTANTYATEDLVASAIAGITITSLGLDPDLATLSLPASTTITAFGASLAAAAAAVNARTTLGLGAAALLADPITAAHGGTGLTSLTAHALQVGNGTGNAVQLGPDASTTKILQAAGSSADPAFVALSGDATIAAGGAVTLKNTGPGATGPLGDATHVAATTIDAQGRVTALSSVAITIPESAVTSLVSDLALKAPLASPALTGTPTAPTQTAGDSSTAIATDAFVTTAVNNALSGLDVKPDVAYAATSALPACTYANGSSGVGATLTGNANGPLLIDGVTILLAQAGQRVLVAAQAAPEQDGWYTITQVGVVAVSPFILTRATESDQATEIGAGYLTGVVAPNGVTAGSNNGKLYISVAADPFVVGTTSLTFSQVGGTYTNGNGISLSGSTFSIDTAVTVDKTTAQTLTNKTIDGSQLVAASVALAKIATQADQTILGNNSGGTAVPSALTASQVRTLLGLVIGTNVQAFDADLTTYAGITPGALGQAILPMTTLTNHGLVLGAGASAPTALAPDSGTTKFLKNTVASDAPTWQTIAESDVTNLSTDLTALQTQTAVQAAQLAAQAAASNGFYVGQGLTYAPNGTPTKLDSTAGMGVIGTTDIRIAAQTAISTTIASLADATNPKWVVVEIDTAGATQFNQGTAAAAPAVPAFTASRIPVALIFVPANATNVDLLLTTNNGLAKLIGLGSTTASAALGVTRGGPSPSGWQYDQNPWVFASATSFTVTGVDATGYLPVGTKIALYDGATKYGIVVAVSFSTNTTVTLVPTYDYTVANATLTAPRFSYMDMPQGFPSWFNWAPTLVGWSPTPSTTVALTSVTSTIATSLLTKTAHGLANGTPIVLTGIATTTGITNLTTYFVVSTAANTFQVAATVGGAAITFGGTADAAIAVANLLGGYRYSCSGRRCTLNIRAQSSSGTSTATGHTATLPITAATVANAQWTGTGNFLDNNVGQVGRATVTSAGTTVNLVGILATGLNTASGSSSLLGVQVTYEF